MTALRLTAMTHRGAVRTSNEDALTIGPFVVGEVEMGGPAVVVLDTREPVVVAVADGLGGHAAGEVAAAHAARRLAGAGSRLRDPATLDGELVAISGEIEDIGRRSPERAGLGTTVAGLVLGDDGGLWFNVGDSRVHQVADGYLTRLSTDDSPAAGRLDGRPARDGRITSYLGCPTPEGQIAPHLGELPETAPGTRWLLCSDGLSDLVGVDEIERILDREQEETRAVQALWVAAMNAGGTDNVSVVLATPVG